MATLSSLDVATASPPVDIFPYPLSVETFNNALEVSQATANATFLDPVTTSGEEIFLNASATGSILEARSAPLLSFTETAASCLPWKVSNLKDDDSVLFHGPDAPSSLVPKTSLNGSEKRENAAFLSSAYELSSSSLMVSPVSSPPPTNTTSSSSLVVSSGTCQHSNCAISKALPNVQTNPFSVKQFLPENAFQAHDFALKWIECIRKTKCNVYINAEALTALCCPYPSHPFVPASHSSQLPPSDLPRTNATTEAFAEISGDSPSLSSIVCKPNVSSLSMVSSFLDSLDDKMPRRRSWSEPCLSQRKRKTAFFPLIPPSSSSISPSSSSSTTPSSSSSTTPSSSSSTTPSSSSSTTPSSSSIAQSTASVMPSATTFASQALPALAAFSTTHLPASSTSAFPSSSVAPLLSSPSSRASTTQAFPLPTTFATPTPPFVSRIHSVDPALFTTYFQRKFCGAAAVDAGDLSTVLTEERPLKRERKTSPFTQADSAQSMRSEDFERMDSALQAPFSMFSTDKTPPTETTLANSLTTTPNATLLAPSSTSSPATTTTTTTTTDNNNNSNIKWVKTDDSLPSFTEKKAPNPDEDTAVAPGLPPVFASLFQGDSPERSQDTLISSDLSSALRYCKGGVLWAKHPPSSPLDESISDAVLLESCTTLLPCRLAQCTDAALFKKCPAKEVKSSVVYTPFPFEHETQVRTGPSFSSREGLTCEDALPMDDAQEGNTTAHPLHSTQEPASRMPSSHREATGMPPRTAAALVKASHANALPFSYEKFLDLKSGGHTIAMIDRLPLISLASLTQAPDDVRTATMVPKSFDGGAYLLNALEFSSLFEQLLWSLYILVPLWAYLEFSYKWHSLFIGDLVTLYTGKKTRSSNTAFISTKGGSSILFSPSLTYSTPFSNKEEGTHENTASSTPIFSREKALQILIHYLQILQPLCSLLYPSVNDVGSFLQKKGAVLLGSRNANRRSMLQHYFIQKLCQHYDEEKLDVDWHSDYLSPNAALVFSLPPGYKSTTYDGTPSLGEPGLVSPFLDLSSYTTSPFCRNAIFKSLLYKILLDLDGLRCSYDKEFVGWTMKGLQAVINAMQRPSLHTRMEREGEKGIDGTAVVVSPNCVEKPSPSIESERKTGGEETSLPSIGTALYAGVYWLPKDRKVRAEWRDGRRKKKIALSFSTVKYGEARAKYLAISGRMIGEIVGLCVPRNEKQSVMHGMSETERAMYFTLQDIHHLQLFSDHFLMDSASYLTLLENDRRHELDGPPSVGGGAPRQSSPPSGSGLRSKEKVLFPKLHSFLKAISQKNVVRSQEASMERKQLTAKKESAFWDEAASIRRKQLKKERKKKKKKRKKMKEMYQVAKALEAAVKEKKFSVHDDTAAAVPGIASSYSPLGYAGKLNGFALETSTPFSPATPLLRETSSNVCGSAPHPSYREKRDLGEERGQPPVSLSTFSSSSPTMALSRESKDRRGPSSIEKEDTFSRENPSTAVASISPSARMTPPVWQNVYFYAQRNQWRMSYKDPVTRKRCHKAFVCSKYGYQQAKQLAITARLEAAREQNLEAELGPPPNNSFWKDELYVPLSLSFLDHTKNKLSRDSATGTSPPVAIPEDNGLCTSLPASFASPHELSQSLKQPSTHLLLNKSSRLSPYETTTLKSEQFVGSRPQEGQQLFSGSSILLDTSQSPSSTFSSPKTSKTASVTIFDETTRAFRSRVYVHVAKGAVLETLRPIHEKIFRERDYGDIKIAKEESEKWKKRMIKREQRRMLQRNANNVLITHVSSGTINYEEEEKASVSFSVENSSKLPSHSKRQTKVNTHTPSSCAVSPGMEEESENGSMNNKLPCSEERVNGEGSLPTSAFAAATQLPAPRRPFCVVLGGRSGDRGEGRQVEERQPSSSNGWLRWQTNGEKYREDTPTEKLPPSASTTACITSKPLRTRTFPSSSHDLETALPTTIQEISAPNEAKRVCLASRKFLTASRLCTDSVPSSYSSAPISSPSKIASMKGAKMEAEHYLSNNEHFLTHEKAALHDTLGEAVATEWRKRQNFSFEVPTVDNGLREVVKKDVETEDMANVLLHDDPYKSVVPGVTYHHGKVAWRMRWVSTKTGRDISRWYSAREDGVDEARKQAEFVKLQLLKTGEAQGPARGVSTLKYLSMFRYSVNGKPLGK